jgi:hypothetical protein
VTGRSNYDDTDNDDEDSDDTDDKDNDNNDDLLKLEYYELEAATKGPPTELLRYVERCHATCSTPELYSAMDSILQTKIQNTLVACKLYTSDWDNQPLLQVTSTTDETAPQHEAPPTLTRPCPHIMNDTSEVDKNKDKAKALPADINPNTNPWNLAKTNANLVPDPAADIISHPKPTTIAAVLPCCRPMAPSQPPTCSSCPPTAQSMSLTPTPSLPWTLEEPGTNPSGPQAPTPWS